MNSLLQPLAPWLASLGWLALEAAVVVLAALALQPFLRAPATRRSLWRAVLVALVLLLAAEFTGATGQLAEQLRTAWQAAFAKPAHTPQFLPSPPPVEPGPEFSDSSAPTRLPVPEPLPDFAALLPDPLPLPAHPSIPPPLPPPAPVWPAFLWFTGLAALLARSAWTHAGFAWLRLRHFLPAAEALRERVQSLATRLGLRRRVRVLASERLRAPAAFGWVRPGVGVPGDFTARFAPAQQDVMLAHELAHLAARDPLWQLLADLVTAALWWHPLAWVARRQHRLAGELAADDASLALPNGPVVLAECLLTLGHEAADCPRAALGMAGFRSQLGRRVERLLALPRRDWQAPSRARLALQTAVALLALAALALLPGCAANRTAGEAPSGIVAKWWQAKKAPESDDVRSLQSNAERGMRNAESSQKPVTSSPTAEEEGKARLSQRAALAREIDEQRKAMLADHQRAMDDYKKLIESATDPAVSIAERDKRKQAAEAKLREMQQIEVRIGEFDREARARLSEPLRKLRDETATSQRLLTSSPTNDLDISVGRQLFVDDFLIESNSLQRTWHQPVLFSTAPLLAVRNQLPPVSQFFESVWFEPTNQHFKLGLAHGVRFFRDFHSPSGTNWLAFNSQSHSGPLVDQPHQRVTTDYESFRVTLSRDAGSDGIRFGFGRSGAELLPQAGQPSIPLPAPTDGSRWTDMHPLRNGFLVVGRNLYFYFGGQVTNHGPPVSVPGFPQQQAAVGLATLRRDGFASLDAGPEGGVMTTKPVTFTGRFLFVNLKTNAPDGELRVEILHPDGRPIEVSNNATAERSTPFSRANCIPLAADQTLMGVNWLNWTNGLASLVGRPVRFRFHLKNASLYSFWVGPGQLGRSMGRVAGGGPHFTNDVDTIGNASYRTFPRTTNAAALKPGASLQPAVGQLAAYVVGVGDVLRVEVFRRPELTIESRVREGGDIVLPLLHFIAVSGKSIAEVREDIRAGYIRLSQASQGQKLPALLHLDDPAVSVTLRQSAPSRPAPAKQPEPAKSSQPGASALPATRAAVQQQIAAGTLGEPVRVTVPGSNREARTATVQATEVRTVAAPPAPVAADVRRLQSIGEGGTRKAESSQSLVTSAATNVPAAKNWTPAQRAILQRLDAIVFPEVVYDGLPLSEVVKFLQADARKFDPEKKGFNFLLNSAAQPLEAPARIDLNTVLIKVTSVFRGLTLAQVLDLVCKTASEPIQFVVEDYGIVFTPRDRAQPFVAPRLVERPAGVLTPAQRALLKRLDAVVFPEIAYDGLPLPEVIKFLEADGRKHDPEKKGFNFLLNSTGQLGGVAEQIDLDVVLIHVNTVLRGLTLNQALDVICKTADVRRPDGRNGGLQFLVEDYGIIFTPRDIAKPFVAPRLVEQPVGAAVRATLDKIVIPEVVFDGLPLPEVLKLLTQDARKHDPTRQGVNLLVTRYFPDSPPGWRGLPAGPDGKLLPRLLDAKGNPIPDPQPALVEPPDLDTVLINVPQVLNGLTLAQVLDVICKTASRPITYRVEDYGVLITPKYPAPPRPAPAKQPEPAKSPKPGASALPAIRAAVQQQIAAGTLGEPVQVTVPGSNGEAGRVATVQATEVRTVAAPPAPVAADVRRLTSPQTPTASLSLLTSAATNAVAAPNPLQAAQEEALRRQERRLVLDKLLGEAKQFQKIKSWTNAVVRYEEALGHAKVLGGVGAMEKQYRDALAGLTHCRIQLAIELQEKYEFKAAAAEVDKIFAFDPKSAEAEQFKRFNDRVEAAHKGRLPDPQAPARRTELLEARSKVMGLVRDGKLYYETGQLQEARKRLEEAIALDPMNDAAFFYLRLVQESQFERESQTREKTYGERVVAVTQKWNEAARSQSGLPVPNPYAKTNSEVPFLTHSSKGAQRINRKLDEIVLPEVRFDAVPLVGVVQRLIEDAKKFDPEKLGLNFLINDVAPAAPLLDAAGNPVPVARPVALSEGLVRVSTPLKNLTLRQALDVICKTAELPTQFSVEEYAIAFIPRGPVAYYSRMFRVNPDTFIQGLQGVVGNPVLGVTPGTGNQPGAAGQNQPAATATTTAPLRATVPATVPATQRPAAEANALVRQFFQSAGVTSLSATNSSTRVTFNPENGLLLVRGTTNDLRVIEQAIQKVQPQAVLPPTNAAPAVPTNSLPKPNVYYRTNSEAPFLTHSSKGAQRNNAKLDEIVLPKIHFDSMPLPQVITWLDDQVKKFDPEKKGLNFLINNVAVSFPTGPVPPQLDPKGNPVITPARPTVTVQPNLAGALVKVPVALTNLTLRQALDVICKTVVIKPVEGRGQGLKYSVEEYGIVFSPKLPERASLFPRMFKVDPETFITGLGSVVDERESRPGSRAALDQALRAKAWTNAPAGTNRFSVGGIPVTNGLIGVASTNVTAELNYLVRLYFTAAGVVNLGVTNGPDATQVFFNDRNGLLLVRASLQDLDIIQQAVELLNVKPPQILIEAKFVVMDQNDGKALGFDWFKGNAAVKPPEAQPDGIRRVWIDREGNYKLDGRARSLDQIESELKAVSRTNVGVVVRIGAEHEARYSDATPVFERLSRIGITNSSYAVQPELSVLSKRPPSAANPTGVFPLPASPIAVPAATGTVTNKVVRTNAATAGTVTGILTAPQFAVILRALEQRAGTEVVSLPKVTAASGKQVVIEPPADAKAKGGLARGLKLEVLPSVDANGYTLRVKLMVTRDGKKVVESDCVVWDAQTVMLSFPSAANAAAAKPGSKAPNLLLFLTPTLVEPAGHRVHTDEVMPFAPAAPARK